MSILELHNVRVLGHGEQLVVLSHGFGASQDVWKLLLPELLPDYKVLLYDLRGHGKASTGDLDGAAKNDQFDMTKYRSVEGFAEDLIAILSELQLKNCLYVGHSVSGIIGCLAAAAQPQLFSKIVLVGASPRYLNGDGYEGGFEEHQVDELLAALKQDCSSWIRGFVTMAMGPDAPEASLKQYATWISLVNPEFLLLIAETIFKSDFRKILPLVTVPCHVLQTKLDFAVPQSVANYLHKQLGGEIRILDARGHLPHLSCPHLMAPVLRQLLSRPE